MTRLSRFSALALVPATVLLVRPAAAQTLDRPDWIPAELALALLSMPYGPEAGSVPDIVVGAVPSSFAIDVPSDVHVLGTLVRGRTMSVVGRTEGPPAEARERLLTGLRADGWTAPERRPRGGFVTTGPWGDGTLCRGRDASARVRAAERDGAGYLWIVHRSSRTVRALCAPPGERRMPPHSRRMPAPTLEPPPGARTRGAGGGSSDDSFSRRARITSTHSVAELADHFGRQLAEQGWRRIASPPPHDLTAVQLWEKENDRGEIWRGVLTITALAQSDTREAVFRAVGPEVDRF